jgi:hypothetical protein
VPRQVGVGAAGLLQRVGEDGEAGGVEVAAGQEAVVVGPLSEGGEGGRQQVRAEDEAVKVPSPLLRKARVLAAARSVSVADYLDEALRPALDRDYELNFDDEAPRDESAA